MRRHLGGGIWEEASGRRHLGGGIWEEASGRRHLGGGIWEEASGRTLGGASSALAALEAPGVSGRVSLHKQAPIRNRIEKCLFWLLLQSVFEGTTHHVVYMATFGDPRLGHRVATDQGASINTSWTLHRRKL